MRGKVRSKGHKPLGRNRQAGNASVMGRVKVGDKENGATWSLPALVFYLCGRGKQAARHFLFLARKQCECTCVDVFDTTVTTAEVNDNPRLASSIRTAWFLKGPEEELDTLRCHHAVYLVEQPGNQTVHGGQGNGPEKQRQRAKIGGATEGFTTVRRENERLPIIVASAMGMGKGQHVDVITTLPNGQTVEVRVEHLPVKVEKDIPLDRLPQPRLTTPVFPDNPTKRFVPLADTGTITGKE